ncbi:type IV toxin-antitoxin system AbiEi family antitoxin domain-containing protein [Terriglobus roseus]|uniref:Transcriptional regulator with AbiEi antitoxin N-terminal domain n=1 Tax=Terriglobus roseus TaxID=392734 RepID=A0A1G7JHI8_9BACT|nr:type IV toxin-antitoxin system AbiEi family antitoxin domain-containing protein [Terriglobus roseus]SDF24244.1 transcriptional regulator with AbiEi antitoxin N-terminal domain [Terriglobus roseus]
MATTSKSKLNSLYAQTPSGVPLASHELANLGISADLAVHYARSGWLVRLARGVYSRPGEALQLHPSLQLLERTIEGFHVGGKTALSWYGVRHFVAQQEELHLYGTKAAKLPDWFLERFPAEYHRKRLFDEEVSSMLAVSSFEARKDGPLTSSPERALLELLSEVGIRQPLQEARELMESTYSFRADVLGKLLKKCSSVKTVRLCLQLGNELSLPWVKKLKPAELPTGSDRPWVSRSKEGLLVLKP